jgi:hypothetical protein
MISKKTIDPRVRNVLDKMGLNYEIDKDGTFEITFVLNVERNQTVSIESATNEFNDLEIREIHSFAALLEEDEFSLELATELLVQNQQIKFGGWAIAKEKGNIIVVFTAKVAADIDADSLGSVLEMVMHQADEMEKMIHDNDRF